MRILFLGILFSFGLACASLQEAVDEFGQGDYARTREILESPNYSDNPRAQIYLLAAQGFGSVDRSTATIDAMKAHAREALEDIEHKDHVAALMVKAFWEIYSENSSVGGDGDTSPSGRVTQFDLDVVSQQPLRRPVATYGTVGEVDLASLEEGRSHAAFGVRLEGFNVEDVQSAIHNSNYFPMSDLFEGTPNIARGTALLKQLCDERVHHAFYFLGRYAFSLEDYEKKLKGLGLIAAASGMNNAESMRLMKEIMGQDTEPGWSHNFNGWCCCGGPACSKRLYCGGDATEKWWICNLGFCGCSTRWSLGELCFNAKNVSRQGLGVTAALAGFGLIMTQNLAQNDLIDLSDGWQNFIFWLGSTFITGGGVTVVTDKKDK